MAVEKMHLINVMGKLENLDKFMEDIINMGDIQPVDAFTQIQNRQFTIQVNEDNVDRTIDFNYVESFPKVDNKEIKNKLEELKQYFHIEDNTGTTRLSEHKINELYEKSKQLIDKKKALIEKREKLKKFVEHLSLLKDEDIDITRIKKLNYFDYKYGKVTEDGRYILKNNYENIPSLIIHMKSNDPKKEYNKMALKQIYAIDDSTSELRRKTDEILNSEKENTQNVLLSLDKKITEETKKESKDLYDSIISSANDKIIDIKNEYNNKINSLKETYLKNKEKLIEDIMKDLE